MPGAIHVVTVFMPSQAEVVERGGSARLLFHVFSMAGWMLFGVMLRDMASSACAPHLSDICGLIVDSAPVTTAREPFCAQQTSNCHNKDI